METIQETRKESRCAKYTHARALARAEKETDSSVQDGISTLSGKATFASSRFYRIFADVCIETVPMLA